MYVKLVCWVVDVLTVCTCMDQNVCVSFCLSGFQGYCVVEHICLVECI